MGSATEDIGNTYDILIAIPTATAQPSLNSIYWVSGLDFQNASAASVRNAIFKVLQRGSFPNVGVSWQAANLGAETSRRPAPVPLTR